MLELNTLLNAVSSCVSFPGTSANSNRQTVATSWLQALRRRHPPIVQCPARVTHLKLAEVETVSISSGAVPRGLKRIQDLDYGPFLVATRKPSHLVLYKI
jgi:hypothetical protein